MPVEPWIPLAGRPLQLPSIGQQLELRDYAQQMQIRNQVQALQSQPGMFEGGLATDKYLIALNQIDRSLGQAETMKRAQQLNYMSLERQRAAAEEEKIEGMRQDALDDVWAVGLRKAYASGNVDDMYKYVDEQLEVWDKSGKAKALRMTPEKLQAARQRRGMDEVQTILLSHGKDKTVEDIRYQHDLEEQKKANRKVMEYTGKPVEGISTEGLPLSDVGKPLQYRGLTEEPPIEQQALEPEKQHVEPPEPTEQPKEAKPKPEDTFYGEREITADRPPVTVEDFYSRAEKLEKLADKAQSSRRKKELLEQANHDRQRAEGLDRSINAERRTDLAEQREGRLALAREGADLRPEDAKFIAQQIWAGNAQAGAGYARGQRNKAEIQKAITEEGKRLGKSPADLNAKITEFHGIQQFSRAAGGRAGNMAVAVNELKKFIPLAEQAMAKVPRTGFVPINRLMQMGQNQWSPQQAAFVAANRSLINAFAQVASRGQPTVHNTEEAEQMLNTAATHAQYKSVMRQLWKEAQGASQATYEALKEGGEAARGGGYKEEAYPGGEEGVESGRFQRAKPMGPTSYGVPSKEQRKAGSVYDTPKGKLKWTGTGWVNP